jgi:hypothetical protein
MTVRIQKPAFNIREKLSELDFGHVPYEKMPAGSVIQYNYRSVLNDSFATSSSTMTDITNFYVDIAPKSANNLLVVSTNFSAGLNDFDGVARYRIVDSNNSDVQWNTSTYMGSSHYQTPQDPQQWIEVVLKHTNVAGTTNPMRLQFQVKIDNGGFISLNWSAADHRIVEVYEIAQ